MCARQHLLQLLARLVCKCATCRLPAACTSPAPPCSCYSRWFPGTNGKCARCPEGCEECEDEKTCLRCASNEEASERGLRLDDDTFTCQLCAEGCQSCDGPQACNFCIEGWTNGTSAEEQCVKW